MKNKLLLVFVAICLVAGVVRAQMPTNNLRVWLKADAIAGLNSGDTVSNWPDSSGFGFDAIQANGDRQPYFYSNTVNGLPVVRFSRLNDYLFNLSYTNPIQEAAVFMVARRIGLKLGGTYQSLFMGGSTNFSSSGSFIYQLTYEWTAQDIRANFAAAGLDILNANATWTTNDFTLLGLTKGVSGAGYSQLHYNGTLKGSGSGAQNLGSGFFLGNWNNSEANIEVAELAIYGSALSTNDRQNVEGALAVKYGLNRFLPADHPWRNGAPAEPRIENRPATNISLSGASLNGFLGSTGSAAVVVSVVWGTANGGAVTSGLWEATNTWPVGAWEEAEEVTYPATGLESNRLYYYRYGATNAAGPWDAGASLFFITAPVDLAVMNGAGAEGTEAVTFSLTRPATATNEAVTVPFVWSGSAQANKDFFCANLLSNIVIGAGQVSAIVTAAPVDDPYAEAEESVILSLVPNLLCMDSAASVTGAIAASEAHAPTATIGYWRFEPVPGLHADSSGNGYIITNALPYPYQTALATNGLSSAFPRTIRDSGFTNAACMTTSGQVAYNPAFTTSVFTIEACVAINDVTTGWRTIASRWSNFTGGRSWLFGVQTNSQRLVFLYMGSSSINVRAPTADFDIQTNKDYYVSVAVDFAKAGAGLNGALFRLRNLTDNGPLIAGYADLPSASFQPVADIPFEIRRYGGSSFLGAYTGWLDELRFSAGVLADSELMIEAPPSRPGAVILVR